MVRIFYVHYFTFGTVHCYVALIDKNWRITTMYEDPLLVIESRPLIHFWDNKMSIEKIGRRTTRDRAIHRISNWCLSVTHCDEISVLFTTVLSDDLNQDFSENNKTSHIYYNKCIFHIFKWVKIICVSRYDPNMTHNLWFVCQCSYPQKAHIHAFFIRNLLRNLLLTSILHIGLV